MLPRRCVACHGPAAALCASCRAALRPLALPRCLCCGAPTAWPVERCLECAGRRIAFASARAAVAYAGPAVPFVRAWKEHGLRHLAPLAADLVTARLERPAADVVTYIPPDRVRQLGRACHPAEALAHELGTRWGIPCVTLLERTRVTERQATMPLARRGGNVRNLFAPAQELHARVLLVDDVYTSGSTANAAARALRDGGATRVEVMTFARAMR